MDGGDENSRRSPPARAMFTDNKHPGPVVAASGEEHAPVREIDPSPHAPRLPVPTTTTQDTNDDDDEEYITTPSGRVAIPRGICPDVREETGIRNDAHFYQEGRAVWLLDKVRNYLRTEKQDPDPSWYDLFTGNTPLEVETWLDGDFSKARWPEVANSAYHKERIRAGVRASARRSRQRKRLRKQRYDQQNKQQRRSRGQ